EDGSTTTFATAAGNGVTVMIDVPETPSLVAVTVAVPEVSVVTSPLASTAATAALSVDQATALPVSKFPTASDVVAVNCCVAPTVTLTDEGVTATAATGAGAAATTKPPSQSSTRTLLPYTPTPGEPLFIEESTT